MGSDQFGAPYIDIDEWRDTPRRHRYVHGGFEDTHTRFSFYFPPEDLYRGRMVQSLEGGAGGNETALVTGFGTSAGQMFDIAFDELGAYVVESNQGHFGNEGTTGTTEPLHLYMASAESGAYSKDVAGEMYGTRPHHSYVQGGSGGGLRSIACIEHRPDVWDGAAPSLIGESGGSSMSFAAAHWWLYCRNQRDDIVDAAEPGGSGDPFATLDADERDALAVILRTGWNRGAESQLWASGSWMYGIGGLKGNDPTYFDDFWSQPGYLGHDHPERLASVLLDETCTVTEVHTGIPPGRFGPASTMAEAPERGASFGIDVDAELGDDLNRLFLARVTVLTGTAAGRQVYLLFQDDATLVGERMLSPDVFDGVEVGDQVRIENRDLVAFAHRWMYALDLDRWCVDDPATGERTLAPEYAGLSALLVDGRPIYPQRSGRMMPVAQTGALTRKVIHVSCTHDTIVPLPSVGHYHRLVREQLGDATDDTYRLWFVEHASHGPPQMILPYMTPDKDPGVWMSRLNDPNGVTLEQLRSLVAWVEDGVPPSPTTGYRYTADSGLVLAPTAAERGGVQPVVQALANGGARADVKVGEVVTFTGTAEQPPGAGSIVSARWDFAGTGDFAHVHEVGGDSASLKVEATHAYDAPGTYFASFRVGAHRDGAQGKLDPALNTARVRVVVTA